MEKLLFALVLVAFGIFVFVVEESIGIFVVVGLGVIVLILGIYKYFAK